MGQARTDSSGMEQTSPGSWGAFLTQFPTDDFVQETAYKANIGTDLRIANALDVTLDVFYQQRRNILVSATTQLSSSRYPVILR